ncbi:MAG: peptidoglycan recognition family protein [Capsulimonadales bacterium]|nr:peptidoglycan recognition family protein [Capsulimonadales bacterium]
MGFGNVGQVWTRKEFEDYLRTTAPMRPWKGVTLHHTAAPSLAQRVGGLTVQHIRNIRDFYEDVKHWSSGPHFFIDEDQIFGMCPPDERGVHATGFNAHYLGIEMLGDYDVEDPATGRGRRVLENSAAATALLLSRLNLTDDETTLKFHRDDPATTKTCPGRRIGKAWFLSLVRTAQASMTPFGQPGSAPSPTQGPIVLLPDGVRFGTAPDETEEIGGRVLVAAYPFGAHFGLDMAGVKTLLDRTEGDFYDKLNGRTMAVLREIAPLLPGGPYLLHYDSGTGTVTLSA